MPPLVLRLALETLDDDAVLQRPDFHDGFLVILGTGVVDARGALGHVVWPRRASSTNPVGTLPRRWLKPARKIIPACPPSRPCGQAGRFSQVVFSGRGRSRLRPSGLDGNSRAERDFSTSFENKFLTAPAARLRSAARGRRSVPLPSTAVTQRSLGDRLMAGRTDSGSVLSRFESLSPSPVSVSKTGRRILQRPGPIV